MYTSNFEKSRYTVQTSTMIGRCESKHQSVRTNSSIPPVTSLDCSQEIACRISTYFKTLLRSSRRRTRLFPVHARTYAQHNHEDLEDVAWCYTRTVELWRSHTLYDDSCRSVVCEDNFVEHLVQICLTLAGWTDTRRNYCELFHPVDQTNEIAELRQLVISLEETWMTWSLCIEIHKQATACI